MDVVEVDIEVGDACAVADEQEDEFVVCFVVVLKEVKTHFMGEGLF